MCNLDIRNYQVAHEIQPSEGDAGYVSKYLEDNIYSCIEFLPRLYPIKPPKGWTKIMMSKLDLTLSDPYDKGPDSFSTGVIEPIIY